MRVEDQVPKGLLVFALAMFTAPATLSASSMTAWLERPDSRTVQAGKPFEIEVRAAFDAPLAAVEFQVSAAGEAQAGMVTRSADPVQPSRLAFISATSQIPFENGLPHDLNGSGAAHEVLIVISEPPFDGLYPGDGVLLERITVIPSGTGTLSISLAAVQAATTRDDPDGTLFENSSVDPERATITVFVHASCDYDGDGDVDLADFHAFQRCFSGIGGQAGETCDNVFDDDHDSDLDLTDLVAFLAGFMGPQTPRTTCADAESTPAKDGGPIATTVTPDVDGIPGVDERDLVYVRARLGTDDDQADANGDSVVDLLDLVAVRNRLGEGGTLPENERLRITEIWPWESVDLPAWIELKYDSRSGVSSYLNAFELVSRSNAPYANGLSTYPLFAEPGYTIVVQFDGWGSPEYLGDGPPYAGLRLHVPKPNPSLPVFDPLGDAYSLRTQDSPGHFIVVDRVEWGDIPETSGALNTVGEPIPEGGSIGRDPIETDSWRRFPTPTPGEDNGLAPPTPYYPFPGAELAGDQVVRFVWLDYRLAAVQYQLQIADDDTFTAPRIDVTVDATVHDLAAPLPSGDHYWRVQTRYRSMEGAWSNASPFTVASTRCAPLVSNGEGHQDEVAVMSAEEVGRGSVVAIPWFVTNGIEAPRKDTHMVCLECREDSGPHAWDAPHVPSSCPHARYYSVQALVATINHYYGGTLSQDEISFYDFLQSAGTPYPVFPEGNLLHGSPGLSSPAAAMNALWWSLDVEPVEADELSAWTIRNLLSGGKPILGYLKTMWAPGATARPIVIYGHDDTSGPGLERVLFYDPLVGSIQLSALQTWIGKAYYCPYTPPQPRQMDPRVLNDSDLDGLVDYDEFARFRTVINDPVSNPDTDADGIGDKTEVWSYIFGQGRIPRIADIDGDGLRAETDSDSDNDGCEDSHEDLNGNGTMGFYLLGAFWGDKEETDPFVEDQFQMRIAFDRIPAKLAFQECANVLLAIDDPDGKVVEDATIFLTVDPTMGSFGPPQGGQPISTAEVITLPYGTSHPFCALEKRGTAQIQASWTRCADSPEPVTATFDVNIVPYDWIFAVQEDALLTAAAIDEEYHIRGWSTEPPREWGQEGLRYQWKNEAEQTVKGHFEYPGAAEPGKWIESISLVFSSGADQSCSVLNIDDVPIVGGHTWTRTSEDQNPKKWEIWFYDLEADWNNFPRYVSVRSGGSTKERRAPLLWWRVCGSAAWRGRTLRREPRIPPGGGLEYHWLVLAYDDHTATYAEFFFGDGDTDGDDIGYLHWQEGEDHTTVGFIPIGTVNGFAIRHTEYAHWDNLSWWMEDQPTSGTAVNYDVFRWGKNDCYLTPPFGWTVTEYDEDSGPTVEELTQQISGAPSLPALLDNITFRRDYIGNDEDELRIRGLTAPDYTVRMRSTP